MTHANTLHIANDNTCMCGNANVFFNSCVTRAQIPGCPYVYVHENHPVINLLRINKSMVGVDVDEQHKFDGYTRVTNSLFDASCDAIKNRILAQIRTYDMNTLSVSSFFLHPPGVKPGHLHIVFMFKTSLHFFQQVQLHRIGGVDWSHVNGADALMSFIPDPAWDSHALEANIKAHQQSFAEKPCTFMARIHLEYEMQR